MLPEDEAAPDFTDPVGLLRACHGRVERFAGLARQLADHPLDGPPEEPVRQAAGRILRYFDQAAPLHHADEEADLLPRLRRRLGPEDGAELGPLMADLEREHAELDAHWTALRPLLMDLAAGEGVAPGAYRRLAEAFHGAQLDHVARENAHLLPAANAHLTAADREELGAAMARRRGVGQNMGD